MGCHFLLQGIFPNPPASPSSQVDSLPETLGKCQPANIIGDIALHFNRFVTHFTHIIHNKHKINQTFSILRDSTLKTIVVQHTPQTGAGFSEQARRVTDWGRGGVGAGRAERLPAMEDEGQAAISLTPAINGTHVHISESSQLEGLYTGASLYDKVPGTVVTVILRKLVLHIQTALPFLTPWATGAITTEACLGCGDGWGWGPGGSHGLGYDFGRGGYGYSARCPSCCGGSGLSSFHCKSELILLNTAIIISSWFSSAFMSLIPLW